jgi:excinuclease UvrABC ATPase subunit
MNILKKDMKDFYINQKFIKKRIPELSKNYKHSISVVIDRIIPSKENRDRLANSIEISLK